MIKRLKWLALFLTCVQFCHSSVADGGETICHFKPAGRWLGDMHPLYRDGEWHLFCFTVPQEPLRAHLYRMESNRFVSEDLIHWREEPILHDEPLKEWWTEGIFEEENRGYSFYSGLGGNPGIFLALSDDMTHWSDYLGNPVIPASHFPMPHARSPYIFRNTVDKTYWMIVSVVTQTKELRPDWAPYNYAGAYYYSTSTDLLEWTQPELLYQPWNINIPECPELFELKKRYYLLGSPHLGDTVGKAMYRIADDPRGPWRRARTEYLDGVNIQAANTGSDGHRRLFYGWIPTYENNQDSGGYQWGGHLAFPREIYSGKDGTLFTRLPEEILGLRGNCLFPSVYKGFQKPVGEEWHIENGTLELAPGSDYAEILLDGDYSHFEITATMTLFKDCPSAGFVFRTGDRDEFVGYEIAIDMEHQQMILRKHLDRRRELIRNDILIKPGKPVELRVFVDGPIVEAFLDNRFSLAGRAHVIPKAQKIGFYSDYGKFRVSKINVYELKDVRDEKISEHPISLVPDPNPIASSIGDSVLFPRMTAHVYTPHGPQLSPKNGLTLECWLKPTIGAGGTRRDVIVKGDGAAAQWHYGLSILRDNSIEFFYRTYSGEIIHFASEPNAIKEGVWSHIAAVLDPMTQESRIYKNGVCIKTGSNMPSDLDQTNTGALRLAFASGSSSFNPFLGLIDEVRIWTRPLSDAEIKRNMSPSQPVEVSQEQVIFWKFDQTEQGAADQKYALYCPNSVEKFQQFRAWFYDGASVFTENAWQDRREQL